MNKTLKYVIGRILFIIPIMLILSFFVFALTYLSPSDPVALKYARMGETPDATLLEAERERLLTLTSSTLWTIATSNSSSGTPRPRKS